MTKRVLFLGIVAALACGSAAAQQFTETMQVTVVEVPVTAVDRAGNPLTGLTQDDFEITDEGKPAKVVGFETIDMTKVIVDNATPLPPAAYRNFLLLFDLANSTPGTIGRAQAAAREFVKSRIGRRDLAAVATFTAERGVNIVTSFTSDRDLLEQAIATLGHPTYFRLADPLRIAVPDTPGRGAVDASGVRETTDVPIAELVQWSQMSEKVRDLELTRRLRQQFASLADVARLLDPLRGQKQILLLSEGFDARLVQGRQDLSGFATQIGSARAPEDAGDDADFGSAALISDIEKMGQVFRRSGVTLHAIDIKGLRSNVDAAKGATRANAGEALHLLTRPSGGSVFNNATDLTENFDRLLREQETVYLLAIESKVEQPGKFHTLKVRVPKAAKVAHRAGYYESLPRTSPLEQTLSLADIMMTDADVREVPLTVTAMPLPSKSGGGRLPIVVEMPGAALLQNVKGNSVTANVFVYAFDEQYQIRDFLQQRIGLDLTRSGAPLREGGGLRYVGMLTLPAGRYAVKALARVEETGRVGFLRTDVDIPATNGPAVLPPVFVTERPGWVNVAAPASGAGAVAALTAAGKAFVPARGGTLKNDGAYRVALFVYDTPADALDITPLVIAADGTSQPAAMSLVGRTPPDDDGAAKVLLDFKPVNIAAGDYKLQFTVKPKDRQASVVELPFRIE